MSYRRNDTNEVTELPPGLLDSLRATADEPVRRHAEMDRVRRRLEHVSLDDERVLHGIATKLLLASAPM